MLKNSNLKEMSTNIFTVTPSIEIENDYEGEFQIQAQTGLFLPEKRAMCVLQVAFRIISLKF